VFSFIIKCLTLASLDNLGWFFKFSLENKLILVTLYFIPKVCVALGWKFNFAEAKLGLFLQT